MQRLTVEDVAHAEKAIICFVQRQSFQEEIAALSKGTVKQTSHLIKLDPVVVDGVLRVGGRLSRAALPEETKHPAILPKNSHISKLILRHVHDKVGHMVIKVGITCSPPFVANTGYFMPTQQPEQSSGNV